MWVFARGGGVAVDEGCGRRRGGIGGGGSGGVDDGGAGRGRSGDGVAGGFGAFEVRSWALLRGLLLGA